MKAFPLVCSLLWGFFLLASSPSFQLFAGAEDTYEDDDQEDEEDQEEAHNDYDPLNENELNPCRRHPTWWGAGEGSIVDYEMCQELTGWSPRDSWWRVDTEPIKEWLSEGKEDKIAECLDAAFVSVPETFWWAACNETDRTDDCYVDEHPFVTAHYAHLEEGDIVTVRNVLSEQEAYGLDALVSCMQDHLPDGGSPFFEKRGEGEEANYGTLLTGMMQKYLPGVAASITLAAQDAYEQSDWSDLNLPAPKELGIRSAQLLEYRKTGRLGLQYDRDSLFTVSVALSEENDYDGGYFGLQSDHALFKVARRSAIVFFSETSNSITPVTGGLRKSLEVEFWEDDDVPLGKVRPSPKEFEAYRLARFEALGVDSFEEQMNDGGGDEF